MFRHITRVPATVVLTLFAALCFAQALQEHVSAAAEASTQAVHAPPPPSAYAGDAACLTCHADIAATYAHTAHHFTSQAPTRESILASFAARENVMTTANPRLVFEMNAGSDGAFTETAKYFSQSGNMQRMTEPIDLVVGSGRKGQTYLWWGADQLFELPVSYWTAGNSWINSPGYQDGSAHFDRPILPRCLECHASFFVSKQPPDNRYERASLVLGIGCERCHGPGAEHVRREQSIPGSTHGRPPAIQDEHDDAIVNPARLPRERQIDTCALCHAGAGSALAPSLSFQPGDVLANYLETPPIEPGAPLDVHTNQVGLLRESKCFRSSAMTCTTCHDVHTVQRDPASFAPKCLTCHSIRQCGEFKVMHAAIKTRCVSCHMPLQQSKTLFSDNTGQRLAPQIRSHFIAIYDDGKPRVTTTQAHQE